jgi:hypothetical protein
VPDLQELPISISPLVAAGLFEVTVPPRGKLDQYLLHVDITEQGADAITGYGLVHGTSAAFVGFARTASSLAST